MKITNEILLPADQAAVWVALNDPAVLQECIPGCQVLEATEDGGFKATVKVKIGPISATFNGRVALCDLDPPKSYLITGAGDGGIAGMAKGNAAVRLSPAEGGTLLSYEVDAQISGKLAQLGARLIDGVARKLSNQFFEDFASHIRQDNI